MITGMLPATYYQTTKVQEILQFCIKLHLLVFDKLVGRASLLKCLLSEILISR